MPIDMVTGRAVEYAMVPGSSRDRVGSDGSWWRKGPRGWTRRRPWWCGLYRGFIVEGKQAHLHRTILLAFLGPPPPGRPFALHADDDRDNNRLDNLRWGSDRDNTQDKLRNETARIARTLETSSPDSSDAFYLKRQLDRRTNACHHVILPASASPLLSRP